jgi:hypothetical protein
MPYAIAAIAVLVIVAFVILRSRGYYGSIFSDDHYAEIAYWASKVIGRHPVEESSVDDGTLLITSAGLVLAYTSDIDEGNRSVHFSVSQQGRYTTGAVGGRVLFLLIRLLHRNECEASLFRTESAVHHAVFRMPAGRRCEVESVDAAVADMAMYQPLPIEHVSLAQEAAAGDATPAGSYARPPD